jgi:hypothetical protein
MKAAKWYALGVLIALDQVANALLGGYPDETVSFRAAKARRDGKRWGCVLCKLLDTIHTNHCEFSLRSKAASLMRRARK